MYLVEGSAALDKGADWLGVLERVLQVPQLLLRDGQPVLLHRKQWLSYMGTARFGL